MLIRNEIEKRERDFLSPYSCLSSKTLGRKHTEKECPWRTAFQRDRDRIVHAKSFRRLKHKTQVFLSPMEDHYRTRLTHTLEVNQIARTLARALNLNEDLTEAIALGHDLGHTPFGHGGEDALDRILHENYGKRFFHNEQSVRVVEYIEEDGKGLNLTQEVIEGIRYHTPDDPWPKSLEGCLVRISDRVAFLHHDIEDAISAEVITKAQLPKKYMQILGDNILDVILGDIIKHSRNKPKIKMSPRVEDAMNRLYDFMYKNVYTNSTAKKEERKVPELIHRLFRYFHYNQDFQKNVKVENQLQHTIDFIAGMTDRFAINKFTELFVPGEWRAKQ